MKFFSIFFQNKTSVFFLCLRRSVFFFKFFWAWFTDLNQSCFFNVFYSDLFRVNLFDLERSSSVFLSMKIHVIKKWLKSGKSRFWVVRLVVSEVKTRGGVSGRVVIWWEWLFDTVTEFPLSSLNTVYSAWSRHSVRN